MTRLLTIRFDGLQGSCLFRLSLILCLLVGCSTDDAPKASHFEHDHAVAEHWPRDLADLSIKLRARTSPDDSAPDEHHHHEGHHDHEGDDHHHAEHHSHHAQDDGNSGEHAAHEIQELVDWVSEIAADSDLQEADWIPLHELSGVVSAELRASDGELTQENLNRIESLCQLIDESVARTASPLPRH